MKVDYFQIFPFLFSFQLKGFLRLLMNFPYKIKFNLSLWHIPKFSNPYCFQTRFNPGTHNFSDINVIRTYALELSIPNYQCQLSMSTRTYKYICHLMKLGISIEIVGYLVNKTIVQRRKKIEKIYIGVQNLNKGSSRNHWVYTMIFFFYFGIE